MMTTYILIDDEHPDPKAIGQAAQFIKQGELVAFPTETVYGLGADALNAQAVEKIFQAKGRPASHPLLIHVSSYEQVEKLAASITDDACALMEAFWPGPLSLILPARPIVPLLVRGGKETVGFRMPSHPVSKALIDAAGPLAAPSANLYGRPSPTSANHVRQDLDVRIAAVLDAGQTGMGMESTVLDLSLKPYRILRRGGVPVEAIEKLLGQKLLIDLPGEQEQAAYRLKLKVILAKNEAELGEILKKSSVKMGVVSYAQPNNGIEDLNITHYVLDLQGEGNPLYAILRDAEAKKLSVLVFAPLPEDLNGNALAAADRIRRASQS